MIGGKEADGVIAPVVGKAPLQKMAVVEEGVHRHQLHRGDAQALEMVDDWRCCQAGIGAAQGRRECRDASWLSRARAIRTPPYRTRECSVPCHLPR